MGIFGGNFGGVGGLGGVLGGVVRQVAFAGWSGVRSPYGLPVPIIYGVAWVTPIQVYAGEQILAINFGGGSNEPFMLVPVYSVDDATGAVSIEEQKEVCQSAVLLLCEDATTILDILKNGVSINTGMLDDTPITTVTQRLRMISGRVKNPDGAIPPTGEEHGYFHGGTGTAVAHTRFSRTANLGAAPYTYSGVARVDLCALGIGAQGARHSLSFKVQGRLAASATVGAHPADVLLDLWERAGKDTADLDVETYYRAYVTGGGGSGSTGWRVNRTIDTQTPARELIQSLLDETFATVIKKEDGTLIVVPRNVAVGGATALGVNDFVKGSGPIITVEMKQASDLWNCFPVIYEVTTASGTHEVTNEDTTYAVAHPFSATETIRRAPPLNATWVSTAEHALNLSHLLAEENCEVRGTYKFRLHKRWVLLQEGDLLSLTEPHLGVSAKVVKITRTSEDANGVIEIEATEWVGAVAYTTPAVDPFDGFGETLPGNPRAPDVSSDSVIAAGGEKRQVWATYLQIRTDYEKIYDALADHSSNVWIAGYDTGTDGAVCCYASGGVYRDYMTLKLGNVNHEPTDTTWWEDLGTDLLPKRGVYFDALDALEDYLISLGAGSTRADLVDEAHIAAWAAVDTVIVPATFRATFAAVQTASAAMSDAWAKFQDRVASRSTPVLLTGGTANFLRSDGSWAPPVGAYDLTVFSRGVPGNAEVICRWIMAHDISFPADFAGSIASAGVVPTAITVLTVYKNGVAVGTITWPASGISAAFSCTAWTVTAGDLVTVENQATADATMALISVTIVGTRTA